MHQAPEKVSDAGEGQASDRRRLPAVPTFLFWACLCALTAPPPAAAFFRLFRDHQGDPWPAIVPLLLLQQRSPPAQAVRSGTMRAEHHMIVGTTKTASSRPSQRRIFFSLPLEATSEGDRRQCAKPSRVSSPSRFLPLAGASP